LDRESNRNFVSDMEKTHGRALRAYVARRLRHATPDIPDLCQEVFLRLLRIPDHEAIRNPQAYLYTIAAHVLQQYALRRAVTAEPIDPADIETEVETSRDSDPAEEAELDQRFERLGQALEGHSPRAYVALVLRRRDGLTLEQIGKHLGVSRPMAKKYLVKAITYCQQRLEEEQE
jgi:RNA polymerase sigma factor (sigma-70 family)